MLNWFYNWWYNVPDKEPIKEEPIKEEPIKEDLIKGIDKNIDNFDECLKEMKALGSTVPEGDVLIEPSAMRFYELDDEGFPVFNESDYLNNEEDFPIVDLSNMDD